MRPEGESQYISHRPIDQAEKQTIESTFSKPHHSGGRSMRHMSARVSWILFGVVIALLVGVGVIATRLTKSLFESEQWVSHTHEVQGVLGSLRGRVLASDNVRLRSLLITPAPAVPEYAIAQQGSQDDLAELRGLTRD